ncbi:MAG TPA: sigma-70 family RNA polymerase sigma factor [Verrucomicrobiae bacterium]|jgi:RNA polymerase sigma-70 factor (ECF subfamily)|nr:sigma-70 family RNA polymerase sigma factor [Verrucomicrobiae bacterium]
MRVYVKGEDKQKEDPEKEIIRQAQEGSVEAFEELYRRYSKRVYHLCLRMVKNENQAEDLTQEAFLLVFRKIHTFEGKSAFSTWLHRVSVNTVLMSLRKKRLVEVPLENDGAYEQESAAPSQTLGGPDPWLTGLFDRENLVCALRELPEGYKRMLILHDALGYEHNEIAAIAGCSAGNSKSQLHKARARMRALLQESA